MVAKSPQLGDPFKFRPGMLTSYKANAEPLKKVIGPMRCNKKSAPSHAFLAAASSSSLTSLPLCGVSEPETEEEPSPPLPPSLLLPASCVPHSGVKQEDVGRRRRRRQRPISRHEEARAERGERRLSQEDGEDNERNTSAQVAVTRRGRRGPRIHHRGPRAGSESGRRSWPRGSREEGEVEEEG